MKKLIIIVSAILLGISMVGCGNSTSKKAIEQGKLAMANKEYDKALSSFKLAIDEGSNDEEIKSMTSIIENYNEANLKFEKGNLEEAKEILDKINKDYAKYSIKDDVDNLKENIDNKIKSQKEISSKITDIKDLVKNENYSNANTLIKELDKNKLSEKDKNEINELQSNIDLQLAKIEEEKKEKEQKQMEEDYANGENWKNGGGVKADDFYEPEEGEQYVCENCEKISEEHNFIMGQTVCNDCSQKIYNENFAGQ